MARPLRSWGLFFGTLHVLGLAVHLEVWHPQFSRDAITVFGAGLSWRQRPLLMLTWWKDALYGTPEIWIEWWGGRHYHWLPTAPVRS